LRSMTAYGRAQSAPLHGIRWLVEIQSVNRKMLDFQIYLPKEFFHWEIELRRMIALHVERGQITLRISLKQEGEQLAIKGLKALKSHWEGIALELGYPTSSINLSFLLAQMGQLPLEQLADSEAELRAHLDKTIEAALADFKRMKEIEGSNLATDLKLRLQLIGKELHEIEKEEKGIVDKFLLKLKERIGDAFASVPDTEERLFREVAMYAEKADISEEITRLRSHLQQFEETLSIREKSIGRTLDFLTQEMQREVGTIGAKAAGLAISKRALWMKAELEKIREQVQNIE